MRRRGVHTAAALLLALAALALVAAGTAEAVLLIAVETAVRTAQHYLR